MNGHLNRHPNRQIPQLHVGNGSHHGRLSIFLVWVDSPRVTGLRTRWQGILEAAGLDARLAPHRRTSAHDARVFARHLQAVTLEDGGDAGLARAVRSQEGRLRASGIVHTNASAVTQSIIHLTAFDDAHPLLENA